MQLAIGNFESTVEHLCHMQFVFHDTLRIILARVMRKAFGSQSPDPGSLRHDAYTLLQIPNKEETVIRGSHDFQYQVGC